VCQVRHRRDDPTGVRTVDFDRLRREGSREDLRAALADAFAAARKLGDRLWWRCADPRAAAELSASPARRSARRLAADARGADPRLSSRRARRAGDPGAGRRAGTGYDVVACLAGRGDAAGRDLWPRSTLAVHSANGSASPGIERVVDCCAPLERVPGHPRRWRRRAR
jgi:hypothetical protein